MNSGLVVLIAVSVCVIGAIYWYRQWLYRLFDSLFVRYGAPRQFYFGTARLLPWLAWPSGLLLVIGIVWGLLFAPQDYQQGQSFRIIYIHVPAASLSMSIYAVMAFSGVLVLVWRVKVAEMVAKACASIGASYTLLALVTGSLWGIPTWGTWWIWDARLTSELLLLFLYLGVLALHTTITDSRAAAKAAGLLSIVGVVNLPIIKYSVDWWNSLHQSATFKLTEKPAMPVEMWAPLLIMVLGSYLLFAVLAIMHTRCEILQRERNTQWVRALVEDSRESWK